MKRRTFLSIFRAFWHFALNQLSNNLTGPRRRLATRAVLAGLVCQQVFVPDEFHQFFNSGSSKAFLYFEKGMNSWGKVNGNDDTDHGLVMSLAEVYSKYGLNSSSEQETSTSTINFVDLWDIAKSIPQYQVVDGHSVVRVGEKVFIDVVQVNPAATKTDGKPTVDLAQVNPDRNTRILVLGDGVGPILPTLLTSGYNNVLSVDLAFHKKILESKTLKGSRVQADFLNYMKKHGLHTQAGDARKLTEIPDESQDEILVSDIFIGSKLSSVRRILDEAIRATVVGGITRVAVADGPSRKLLAELLPTLTSAPFNSFVRVSPATLDATTTELRIEKIGARPATNKALLGSKDLITIYKAKKWFGVSDESEAGGVLLNNKGSTSFGFKLVNQINETPIVHNKISLFDSYGPDDTETIYIHEKAITPTKYLKLIQQNSPDQGTQSLLKNYAKYLGIPLDEESLKNDYEFLNAGFGGRSGARSSKPADPAVVQTIQALDAKNRYIERPLGDYPAEIQNAIQAKADSFAEINFYNDADTADRIRASNYEWAQKLGMDASVMAGLLEVGTAMTDIPNWRTYLRNLYLDSVDWTLRRGALDERTRLRSGKVSRRAMLAVLAARALARQQRVRKAKAFDSKFFDLMVDGPVMDKSFSPGSSHGQITHWMQGDYIAGLLPQIGLSYVDMANYFRTQKGKQFFDFFCDSFSRQDFTRPEHFGPAILPYLPMGADRF